ncbi:hypothetical protein AVEN_120980-1 [Araneus ventricosus]|uniref:Uncharacterized protein n=1 Tax=Araneus ventricosus TaxID=182803 RepID=A0A4Y2L9L3_ARAVE|nr:hypothetical protein AVEN_120980-1 [Araneus ventricosus]
MIPKLSLSHHVFRNRVTPTLSWYSWSIEEGPLRQIGYLGRSPNGHHRLRPVYFRRRGVQSSAEGTQPPQLLYPPLKQEPANLSDNFSSTYSRCTQIRVITKYTKKEKLSHHFKSFLAPPLPLNPIHCNEFMTRLLENSCRSPPILMMICRNILAIKYLFIEYEPTRDMLQ